MVFKHIKVQLERINTLSMIIKYIYLSQIFLFQCKFSSFPLVLTEKSAIFVSKKVEHPAWSLIAFHVRGGGEDGLQLFLTTNGQI